ncbi:MAG: 30S ribosomal protein S6 [Candidatus Kerfeldbacteria bacterium]|nr:30S ribosomal protein S6 [Candidatus Kerfeldbacteria bacterium]
MQHYEVLVLFPGKYAEEETKGVREKITTLITERKGDVTFENFMGLRRLAYPIKHERQGYYFAVEFNAEPSVMQEIDRTLSLETDVIRHLIVQKHEMTEEERVREQAMAAKFKAKQAERRERLEKESQPARGVARPAAKTPAPVPPTEPTQAESKLAPETAAPAPAPVEKKTKEQTEEEQKSRLDELDKKLDEILDDTNIKL